MKREILFRGKRIDNGEWVEGYYWNNEIGNCFIKVIKEKELFVHNPTTNDYEITPSTVGQFTGLKDINGKKIFEGDRVRYGERIDFDCHEESIRYPEAYGGKIYDIGIFEDVVVWYGENGYPAFDIENHDMECNALSVISSAGDYVVEVIGTIFDNEE